MILFYDTETTGFPTKQPPDDPSQPHLVQLALALCEEDGTEVFARSTLIRPGNWTISGQVTAIHGVTQEHAMDQGMPEDNATGLFVVAQARARLRVAHNQSFDQQIMLTAMIRAGYQPDFIEAIIGRPAYCTCRAATPIVNLPPTERMAARGMKGPKTASLSECIKHFFNEPLVGAHDALVDTRACARLYFHLNKPPRAAARKRA